MSQIRARRVAAPAFRSRRLLLAVLAPLALLPGPALAQGRVLEYNQRNPREAYLARVRGELEALEVARRIAWERDDARALAEFYAEDAVLYLPDGTPLVGRAALRAHFAQRLPTLSEIVTSQTSFGSSGDLAFEGRTESYRIDREGAPPALHTGTKLIVYERKDGQDWRIKSEMAQGSADSGEAAQAALSRRVPQVVLREEAPFRPARTALALSAGTLGIGVEASRLLTDWLAVRVAAHALPGGVRMDLAPQRTTYGSEFRPRSATALVSVFPVPRAGFHLSGGLLANRSELVGIGEPAAFGRLILNSRPYESTEVGTLTAEVSFPEVAPYLGIGLKPLGEGMAFEGFADLGVALGSPTLALDAPGAASDPRLAADLEAERAAIQEDLDRVPFYPVFTWSLSYRF